MGYTFAINGKKFEVVIGEVTNAQAKVSVNNVEYIVAVESPNHSGGNLKTAALAQPSSVMSGKLIPTAVAMPKLSPATDSNGGEDTLSAPIPGLILEVRVKVGDRVAEGQTVAIMEAMKMENNLIAQKGGTVSDILVQKGTEVSTGDAIMIIR